MRIILASRSPRRKEILTRIGYEPIIRTSGFDESSVTETDPEKLVKILSSGKAEDVYKSSVKGDIVIAADTVVAVDGQILGKPKDREQAAEMLHMISDRAHEVYTGVTVMRNDGDKPRRRIFAVKTKVYVARLSQEEIAAYIATGDPMDKAGSYGIQGLFGRHVEKIDGDWYNVMGLPAAATYKVVKEFAEE